MSQGPKLLFVVTEDWFFVSHFLGVAVAARAAGYDVAVTVRIRDPNLRARIESHGIRVIPSAHARGQFGPAALGEQVRAFASLFARERPALVHIVSLRLIVIAGLAARLAGVPARVLAVTGFGLLGIGRSARARAARAAVRLLLRGPLAGRGTAFVFENSEDPATLGLSPEDPRVLIVGGAGIDPERESALPLPSAPPLRVAVVARMVHSKGVDVAVSALRRARAAGADVTLSLYGAPDAENPRAVPEAELRAWAAEPGIAWHGHTDDVRAVWRDHHVVCVPSRGGEGLPRSLLEGAAAGRAVVTTATPGCATFAREGIEGFVVPPDDPEAMARAFVRLAGDGDLLVRCAAAARARVLDGFTRADVAAAFCRLYARMRPPDGGQP